MAALLSALSCNQGIDDGLWVPVPITWSTVRHRLSWACSWSHSNRENLVQIAMTAMKTITLNTRTVFPRTWSISQPTGTWKMTVFPCWSTRAPFSNCWNACNDVADRNYNVLRSKNDGTCGWTEWWSRHNGLSRRLHGRPSRSTISARLGCNNPCPIARHPDLLQIGPTQTPYDYIYV
jgi:hypothetical protein